MSSPSQALCGGGLFEGRVGLVADGVGLGVVAGAVAPAGPDDAQPGAGQDPAGVRVAFAGGSGVVVDLRGPGEGGDGYAGSAVGGVAEEHVAVFAGFAGDRDDPGFGNQLPGAGGPFEHRPDLADDLGEVDRADA